MAEREDIPVIGGLLHEARFHWQDVFADWTNYRLVHVQGHPTYIPRQWPHGAEAQGIALVRIYGADETVWPDAALYSLYAPREGTGP